MTDGGATIVDMAAKDDLGRAGEARAAAELTARGWHVLDRNWRSADGELDIVALDGDELVIVEVKTRSDVRFGHPFEAIDRRKHDRLWRLAVAWARAHRSISVGRVVRLDLVAVIGPDAATARLEHLADLR